MSWAELRQLIETSFNDQELRTLCFDLNVDYDSLEGIGKEAKVREFIAWTRRTGLFPELVAALKSRRPNVDWQTIGASDETPDASAGLAPDSDMSEPGGRAHISGLPFPEAQLPRARAEEFFYTLDDPLAETFPNMVKDAIRVQILGRTAVNLLGQYQKVLTELGNRGCEVQLLFVDPASQAAEFLYGSDPEFYRSNITIAARQIKKLKQTMGNRLQVRATKHAPTVSVIIIEKQERSLGYMHVQLYFLHSAVGRDRPAFRLDYDDKWYSIFLEEYSQLWSGSSEWSATNYLDKLDR